MRIDALRDTVMAVDGAEVEVGRGGRELDDCKGECSGM